MTYSFEETFPEGPAVGCIARQSDARVSSIGCQRIHCIPILAPTSTSGVNMTAVAATVATVKDAESFSPSGADHVLLYCPVSLLKYSS